MILFVISFSTCSLLVHRNVIDFCVYPLFPMKLINKNTWPKSILSLYRYRLLNFSQAGKPKSSPHGLEPQLPSLVRQLAQGKQCGMVRRNELWSSRG